jgi:hypothetical protein
MLGRLAGYGLAGVCYNFADGRKEAIGARASAPAKRANDPSRVHTMQQYVFRSSRGLREKKLSSLSQRLNCAVAGAGQ